MRYPASEKLEIIRFVEQSHLSARRTLANLGIAKTTFYRWYDRYLAFGETGLDDRTSGPGRVWNRIPDDVRGEIVDLALEEPELSPSLTGNWPSGSRTPRAILSRKPRSIGFSRPTT